MTKYNLTLAGGQTEEKVCAIGRSYPNILKPYLNYFSSYKHFLKLKMQNSNMGLNDKV